MKIEWTELLLFGSAGLNWPYGKKISNRAFIETKVADSTVLGHLIWYNIGSSDAYHYYIF